jgi:hypothetical protein
VYIQACLKGVSGITTADAEAILRGRGLACTWWRKAGRIRPEEIQQRLTRAEVSLHVNAFGADHPTRGGRVGDQTPFISLTAGAVERKTWEEDGLEYGDNIEHGAFLTALAFASRQGEASEGFLFYCWVMVGLRPRPEIRHLAEEVRELNTYRGYSPYQREGEILAKVEVPANQIEKYERYEFRPDPDGTPVPVCVEMADNPDYVDPHLVTPYRGWF